MRFEDVSVYHLSAAMPSASEYIKQLEAENFRLRAELEECRRSETSLIRERDLLLKEVHHRVKNNLQIILSLMNLQREACEGGPAEKPIVRSSDRILSLALLYDQLYRADGFKGIDLQAYCEELVQRLILENRSTGIQTELDIDPLPGFDLERVFPFGLILGELVSNSLLHGMSRNRCGRLRVSLKSADHGFAELKVWDNGDGCETGRPVSSGSLGLCLVETLSAQLGAVPVFETRDGFSCSIVFPVAGH